MTKKKITPPPQPDDEGINSGEESGVSNTVLELSKLVGDDVIITDPANEDLPLTPVDDSNELPEDNKIEDNLTGMEPIQEDPPLTPVDDSNELPEDNKIDDEELLGLEDDKINVKEIHDQAMMQESINENPDDLKKLDDIKKEEDSIAITAVSEPRGRINPLRMYDERERQISMDALQMIYDARNPMHRGILKYPAVEVGEYKNEKCLFIYIPNIYTGVEGILPESKAGLRKGQSLESLLRMPFLRVTPDVIMRDEGRCTLNRELAEKIEAQRTWKDVSEGQDVDAVVIGVRRNPENHRPYYVLLDLGGILARMPINEVSHNYVHDINYARGEILKVRVIEKKETPSSLEQDPIRKYKVSLRAKEFNPWAEERYIPKIGQQYIGIVMHNSEKWLHVRLSTGVEVLAPRPSLNYAAREKLTTLGNKVTIIITKIDRDKRFVRGNFDRREAAKEIKYYTYRQLQQKA